MLEQTEGKLCAHLECVQVENAGNKTFLAVSETS